MRTIGRRKTDKVRMAVGMLLGATIFATMTYTHGCQGTTVSGPTSEDGTPQAPIVAATPVPTPSPTPKPADGEQPKAFELWGGPGSCLYVKYTGQASHAWVDTYYTSFDDQKTAQAKQSHHVATGGTIERCFGGGCKQGDADQQGVKEIGGIFFDKNGDPFNLSKHPEKVAECRTVPCVEKWVALEEATFGEWSAWSACSAPVPSTVEQQCSHSRTRKVTYYEQNSCTLQKRVLREATETQTEPCECACVETWIPQPPIVTTSAWSECVLGVQTRTVRTVINELNSCTQAVRILSDETRTETRDCQTPGHCYYKVSGGDEGYKQFVCEFPKPIGGGGIWINFDGSKLDNHCDVAFPGISRLDFQLTPGQSAPGCLNKHD